MRTSIFCVDVIYDFRNFELRVKLRFILEIVISVGMAPGVAHRPGAFKQSNKTHNTGKHRSKGAVSKENRGRVAGKLSGGGSKKAGLVISKADRRNRAVQLRRAARAEVAAAKRAVGGAGGGPPLLLTVIPLYSEALPGAVLDQLAVALPDTETSRTATGALQLAVPRLKARLTVVAAPAGSLQAALDLCKVADSVVFLVCGQEGWDQHGDSLLSAVMAQGLPSAPLFLATGLETLSPPKRQEAKKLLAKALNKKLPVEKVGCKVHSPAWVGLTFNHSFHHQSINQGQDKPL